MVKPNLFLWEAPKSTWGDTIGKIVADYIVSHNQKCGELSEQVRLKVKSTARAIGNYFATLWRAGKTKTFTFFVTRSYLAEENHPLVKAGKKHPPCCNRTIYNHLTRLEKAGILQKESMLPDTKYQFEGKLKPIPCLRLTWGKAIQAVLPKDEYPTFEPAYSESEAQEQLENLMQNITFLKL